MVRKLFCDRCKTEIIRRAIAPIVRYGMPINNQMVDVDLCSNCYGDFNKFLNNQFTIFGKYNACDCGGYPHEVWCKNETLSAPHSQDTRVATDIKLPSSTDVKLQSGRGNVQHQEERPDIHQDIKGLLDKDYGVKNG